MKIGNTLTGEIPSLVHIWRAASRVPRYTMLEVLRTVHDNGGLTSSSIKVKQSLHMFEKNAWCSCNKHCQSFSGMFFDLC